MYIIKSTMFKLVKNKFIEFNKSHVDKYMELLHRLQIIFGFLDDYFK